MKQTDIKLLAIISGLTFTTSIFSQSFEFNNKLFHYENNILYVRQNSQNTQFQVDTEVITVKPLNANQDTQLIHYFLSENNFIILRKASTGFIDIKIPQTSSFEDSFLMLQNSGYFSIVEENTIGYYTLTPNDPEYVTQWHLPIVQAEAAWDMNSGSQNIVVAVLDSGTEFTHSDLGNGSDAFNIFWHNPGEDAWSDPNDPSTGNGLDDDGNGYVDDWIGYNFDLDNNNPSGSFYHGTAVAGVTAAKTNNSNGVAGVAGGNNSKGTSIMIGNVGNTAPNGSVLDDAILYAAANGANIVQLSLSVGQNSAIDAAITEAYVNQGLLVINAAGNSGAASVGYPASNPMVMAIGASTPSDLKASFSQYGPDLEVSAPGTNIRTTDLSNSYTTTSGTSFSAPLTSGIASLIWGRHPSLTNDQVREILQDSADKVGGYDYNQDPLDPGRSLEMGYGRVNAHTALTLSDTYVTPVVNLIFKNGFESDIIFENGFE